MSVQTETSWQTPPAADQQVDSNYYEQYRALSSLAVAGLVLAVLSAFALMDWTLALIPLVALIFSALALRSIRARPAELTGLNIARAGLVISSLFLVSSLAYHTYIYKTEVPPGYERISYSQLQFENATQEEILALEGKRVFIKGYALQGAISRNINVFTLVRDSGTCCFGSQEPKLTDKIHIVLKEPLVLKEWSMKVQKLAGTFHVAPGLTADKKQVIYHLEADYIE
jgi:hypothetical protein